MRFFSLEREDLSLGQSVIVAARWLLVAAGLALALVAPVSPELLRAQVAFVLLLAVCNFGLQAQILRRQPTLAAVAYAASAADIAIITALVAVNGGFASGLYVFYFPAILALAVAFPPGITVAYVAVTIVLYLTVAARGTPSGGEEQLLIRCLVLVAMAVCGTVYSAIEASRRRGDLGLSRPIEPAAAEVS